MVKKKKKIYLSPLAVWKLSYWVEEAFLNYWLRHFGDTLPSRKWNNHLEMTVLLDLREFRQIIDRDDCRQDKWQTLIWHLKSIAFYPWTMNLWTLTYVSLAIDRKNAENFPFLRFLFLLILLFALQFLFPILESNYSFFSIRPFGNSCQILFSYPYFLS